MVMKILARLMVVGSLVAYAGCKSGCPKGSSMVGDPASGGQGCQKPDGTKHGKWTNFHKNGQKKEEGEYKDGKEQGKWTEWYANGQKKMEGEYNNGALIGIWNEFHPKGQKKSVAEFKEGVVNPITWTCYNKAGTEITCR